MSVTPEGREISLAPVFAKALAGIFVSERGSFIETKFESPSIRREPMLVNLLGLASVSSKVTVVNFFALAKAESPMDVTEAGTWIRSTFDPRKAFLWIDVTPAGILTSFAAPLYARRSPDPSKTKPEASAGRTLMVAEAV